METIEQKTVKIRKPCDCFGCGRTMPVGTQMGKVFGKDGGVVMWSAWCMTCQEYWRLYMDGDDMIDKGELKHEDLGAWEAVRAEIEG